MAEADSVLEERLEEERRRLKAELERLGVTEQENPAYSTHIADVASEVFEQVKNLAICRNLERLLAQVEDALDRLEKGTYGFCEDCGARIDPARLKALPYATLCIECQKRRERS